jgi:capsular exopolysaccharide synthesis family protein
MDLRDVARALRRRKWLFVGFVALVIALATAFALTKPKVYEATSTVVVFPAYDTNVGPRIRPEEVSTLLETYAETVTSQRTLSRAEELLGRPVPGEVTAATKSGTGIVYVIGRDEDPRDAWATADAAGRALVYSVEFSELVRASVISRPRVPTEPVQPRPPLIIGAATLLALIGGLLLVLVVDRLRGRVESGEDVAPLTTKPVLGHLPLARTLRKRPDEVVWGAEGLFELKEALRALRVNVDMLLPDDGSRQTLLVTSATPEQGKSTVVANLGAAFALAGRSTVIVDADFRNPRQHALFGLDNSVGLTNLLRSGTEPGWPLAEMLQTPDRFDLLRVLPSGPHGEDTAELLPFRFQRVLDELPGDELVLIDSPPLLAVSDARSAAAVARNTLLVVNATRERVSSVRRALSALELMDARLLGVVLNALPRSAGETVHYDYEYAR